VLPVKLLVMCLAFRFSSPGWGLCSECSTLDSHC
jgi:hypothetical protein